MKLNYQLNIFSKKVSLLPIVFIHGLFGSLSNFNTLSKSLNKKNYDTLQIDLRNHGKSPHNDLMNYKVMAKDIIDLLDVLFIDQFIVIGHSMGGKVAMTLPSLSKDRIIKMIILDIAPIDYVMQHYDIFTAIQHVDMSCTINRIKAFDIMNKFITNKDIIFFLLKSFKKGKWDFNIKNIQKNYSTLNKWEYYAPWCGNVLFIAGGESLYIQKSHYNCIYQQFPKASIHIINGASHWVHSEKHNEILGIINQFLQK